MCCELGHQDCVGDRRKLLVKTWEAANGQHITAPYIRMRWSLITLLQPMEHLMPSVSAENYVEQIRTVYFR